MIHALGTIVLCACGCASISIESSPVPAKEMRSIVGTVASVNSDYGHIVVECEVPPAPGTRADIYRGRRKIGTALFGDKSKYPCAVAEILEGEPRENDILIHTL